MPNSPNTLTKKWLWDHGHFANPAFPNALNVEEVDLPRATFEDDEVKDAVKSIQLLDGNFDVLCQEIHQRDGDPDGKMGPATSRLIALPRCGTPDFSREEAGQGSWPDCDPNSTDGANSVRFYVDSSRATATQLGYLAWVKRAAQECCAEAGLRVRYVDNPGEAELRIVFGPIRGNVIGFFNILQQAICHQVLEGELDTGYNPERYLFALLFIHEALGHGIGHEHTRKGIMNPSIMMTPATPAGWPSYKIDGSVGNTAWERMVEWFGGVRVPIIIGDPIDPDPFEEFYIEGPVRIMRNGNPPEAVSGNIIHVPE